MHHVTSRFTTAIFLLALAAATLPFAENAPFSAARAISSAATPTYRSTSPYAVTPGVPWAASDGSLIQGHNGSVIQFTSPVTNKSAYYWIGQNENGARDSAACYESTDLVHWNLINGDVLHVTDGSTGGLSKPAGWPPPGVPSGDDTSTPTYLMGPTKILETSAGQLVLWAGVSIKTTASNYHRPAPYFLVDVATNDNDSPCDSYTWNRPAPFYPFGKYPSGDIGVFQDATNGSTYLLSEDQGGCISTADPSCQDHTAGLRIILMEPGDLDLDKTVHEFTPDQDYEAPAMFQDTTTGYYYVLASKKTGWVPNDNFYNYTTDSTLTGGWDTSTTTTAGNGWQSLVPNANSLPLPDGTVASDSYTCDSQTFFVLPVSGAKGTSYIYMGDRWDSADKPSSGYVWLPLQVDHGTVSLNCGIDNFSINTATGQTDTLADPYIALANASNGKVLEEPGYKQGTGTELDLAANNGRTTQQWQLFSIPYAAPVGNYTPHYVIENVDSGMVLENLDGCIVQDAYSAGDAYQLWAFELNTEPNLTLKNIGSGGFLELQGSPPADCSTDLGMASSSSNGDQSQQWTVTEVPGYWAYTLAGNVLNQQGTPWFGSLASANVSDVVSLVPTSDGAGYWLVEADGDVTAFGDATPVSHISSNCSPPFGPGPIEGATAQPVTDPSTQSGGFWAYTWCGNVYGEAGAPNLGSTTAGEVAALAATPDGQGYWLILSYGPVYNFGDATPVTGGISTTNSITYAAGDPQGGFWAVDDLGDVYAEAGAHFFGEESGIDIAGFAPTPDGLGYWLVDGSGNVYHFGDATQGANLSDAPAVLWGAVADPNI